MKCKKRSERKEAKSWKPEQEKMRFQWAEGKWWRTGRNWNSEISSEWCYITVVGDDLDSFSFLPDCSINRIVSIFLSEFPHLPCKQEGCFSFVSDRVGHVLPPDWSVFLRLSLRTNMFDDARHFFCRMFSNIVDVGPGQTAGKRDSDRTLSQQSEQHSSNLLPAKKKNPQIFFTSTCRTKSDTYLIVFEMSEHSCCFSSSRWDVRHNSAAEEARQ